MGLTLQCERENNTVNISIDSLPSVKIFYGVTKILLFNDKSLGSSLNVHVVAFVEPKSRG
jgi:hypothetical protein